MVPPFLEGVPPHCFREKIRRLPEVFFRKDLLFKQPVDFDNQRKERLYPILQFLRMLHSLNKGKSMLRLISTYSFM